MAKIAGLERIKQVLMLGLVQIFPPKNGLSELIFGGAEERTYDVETVLIDVYDGKRGIAGYTARGVKGQTLGLEGWKTISITPPLIDEGFSVSAQDLKVRSFGDSQFESKSAMQKLKQLIRVNLKKLLNRRQRAYNLQVAQLLTSGIVTVREYDDRGKALPARKIDFKMPAAHKFTAPVAWTDPNADILADIRKVDELTSKASGLKTKFIIIGSKGLSGMLNNKQLLSLLDNRSVDAGSLKFGEAYREELDNGLTCWGVFGTKKIYTFDDWYTDPANPANLLPYIPEDMALFCTNDAEVDIAYGSLDAMVNGMPSVIEAKQLLLQKPDEDLIAIENKIKSAKLYCLTQAGAFAAVKVA